MHPIRSVRFLNNPGGGRCWRGVEKVLGDEHPAVGGIDNLNISSNTVGSGDDALFDEKFRRKVSANFFYIGRKYREIFFAVSRSG